MPHCEYSPSIGMYYVTLVLQRSFIKSTVSTSIGMTASKPLRRANAVIIPSRTRKPLSRVGNLQPSAAELNKLGIKVRDFASEKTLPPVRTLHLHRQILPGVARPIARQNTEEDLQKMQ